MIRKFTISLGTALINIRSNFHAAYTLNTLLIISIVTLLTGIICGTWPALRASRLDPVEAIRKE